MTKRIGICAVQGAFAEHCAALERIGAVTVIIRGKEELRGLDALVLPGGESTAQGLLLRALGLFEPMRKMIKEGLPAYGTCAGMILLAKDIENDSRRHLAIMDIKVRRNGYGRQLSSFNVRGTFAGLDDVEMPFIRAPYISGTGSGVEVLAETDGLATAARENNMLVTAFHPEVTDDTRVHEYFLSMI
ncbi:MAG: pyridoxal 5'-phosphate synthase glutaminase subunit PdxT [Synergistes jonesii]|uniref:pyridoxal 5'-phosphate synthase glutaminase subunit PdxT n=1 Tax=Synergistes jonesii TaxID=2754 RepID=UPI002A74741D|nr:pyridoxal 5'-phosphate synthase glutaminase subunit PdxT [Synergistes jonesii]MDY2984690.1 pyridoxal 5'-phosphate synthase glutaminase subunit PdxT [Synergistes jonesii]